MLSGTSVLILISNLYVSIFTGFVTSNLLIVIIQSDLKLFVSKPFYFLFMYLFIFFKTVITFIRTVNI